MEITRRTDYAIRILLALARQPDGVPVSSRELGRAQDVPYPFARGILTELVAAGFVASRRGAGGGVVLARPPDAITVLEVVEAMEGRLTLNLCTRDEAYCRQSDACLMHGVWLESEDLLRRHLAGKTIGMLAHGTGEAQPPSRRGGEAVA